MLDQAAGLRRLLGKAPLRAIALAGAGATTLTVNLASALGAAGMDVLVVDENTNHGNVSDQLGLSTRYELVHALNGDCQLQDAICEAAAGVCVLPAARGARELARVTNPGRLKDCMRQAGPAPDLLLIDSASGGVSRLLRGAATCETVIVAGAAHNAITRAYGLIKNAAQEFGDGRFQVVVSRVRDAAEAEAIFRNMAEVARRHIGVELEFLGWLPNAPQFRLARAAQRSVIDAFPAGTAAAAIRTLAQRLRSGRATASAAIDFSSQAVATNGNSRDLCPVAAIQGHAGSLVGSLVNTQPRHAAAAVFS
jgi:flagellar biosynthesis protein FlhG